MTILLKIMIIGMNAIYFFLKLFPTQNKVLLMSRQSNKKSLDFCLLENELSKKYNVVCLCNTLPGKENAKIIDIIKYGFNMFKQMYHLATSKVCVLDSYIPTISILKHKKNLTIIQMWHSNGTMKKFGYMAINKEEGVNEKYAKILKMHKNYDIVLCSSMSYAKHLAQGFGIDIKKIKIYSLPRIDLLNDLTYEKKVKNKIYKKYPKLKEKTNVLYTPTFRNNEEQLEKQLNSVIKNFNFDKYNLIIKLHPLTKIKIKSKKAIIDYEFSSFDMLFIADKLISDYSCIIYEAGVRNIPLYFCAYDIRDYEINRGLFIDYKELPGIKSNNALELIKNLDKDVNMKYQQKFIKKYVNNTNNCTQKIVDLIDKYMN